MAFFPLPRTYAVAQIDLPASLRGLDELDREALSTLRKIRSSKAIIMLHTASELPFLRRPDFKYLVYAVGPKLRPEDPEQGYTADMCMPIFPNTDHPTGRPFVRTIPEFPFSNCYHWFGPDISLKVRIKNDTYPPHGDPRYIRLDTGDYIDMETIHQQEITRIFANRAERKSSTLPTRDESQYPQQDACDHSQTPLNHNSAPESIGGCGMVHQDGNDSSFDLTQDEDGSSFGSTQDGTETDSLASGPSDPYVDSPNQSCVSFASGVMTGSVDSQSVASSKSLTESDIFEQDWSVERSRIPVVTVSFDLAEEFKEEDVPSPEAFLEECSIFSRMVTEFQEREALRRAKREARERKSKEVSDKIARVLKLLKGLLRSG